MHAEQTPICSNDGMMQVLYCTHAFPQSCKQNEHAQKVKTMLLDFSFSTCKEKSCVRRKSTKCFCFFTNIPSKSGRIQIFFNEHEEVFIACISA